MPPPVNGGSLLDPLIQGFSVLSTASSNLSFPLSAEKLKIWQHAWEITVPL
jgi:hypothetical protein